MFGTQGSPEVGAAQYRVEVVFRVCERAAGDAKLSVGVVCATHVRTFLETITRDAELYVRTLALGGNDTLLCICPGIVRT